MWGKIQPKRSWMYKTNLVYKIISGLEINDPNFEMIELRKRVKEWRARAELLYTQVREKRPTNSRNRSASIV